MVEGGSGSTWLHSLMVCCETSLVLAEPTDDPEMVWNPAWELLAIAPFQDT